MNIYPLVSLIVPIYNVELYIERCLLSALNQTYQNIEIILIDDCGQDNSMDVSRRIIETHPRGNKVSILQQKENRGPSAARNRGIKSAKGEYIYFLDSDDEITIDCIDTLITSCKDDDIVLGSLYSEGKANRPNIGKRYTKQNGLIDAFFKEEIDLYACNKLLLKDFIISNNLYFPEMLHEDFIWTYNMIVRAKSINLIPDFTYKYTLREDSRTRGLAIPNIYALGKSLNYIEEDISQRGVTQYAIIFLIKNWWDIKYQACQKMSYTDFRKLDSSNKKYPIKGIKLGYKVRYYILRSSIKAQYNFFKLYLNIKKMLKIS